MVENETFTAPEEGSVQAAGQTPSAGVPAQGQVQVPASTAAQPSSQPGAPDPACAATNASFYGTAAGQGHGSGESPYGQSTGGYAQQQQPASCSQSYGQPMGGAGYGQPNQPYAQAVPVAAPGIEAPLYAMTETDRTLRLIAFIFMVVSLASTCWLLLPLAWMIPMTVVSWGIYKGTRPNTVAFGVCSLIFCSLVAGILLLISKKDR